MGGQNFPVELFDEWLSKRRPVPYVGVWGGSEFEQGVFDANLSRRPEVQLVSERDFASQSLIVEVGQLKSPYMHWYGQTKCHWTGKAMARVRDLPGGDVR